MILKTMPLSTNALYRGRRFLTKEGKTNKEAIAWEAKVLWNGGVLKSNVRLRVALYWPNKRRHDLDNIKGLLDSLTGIVYEDDSQIVELHISKFVDAKNPRTEVSLM